MRLTVEGFENGGKIPVAFTCDGEDKSPAIKWEELPEGTMSLALALDDPDAPMGTFTHWIVYNIKPEMKGLEGALPQEEKVGTGVCQGANDFGTIGYKGPCPPQGKAHTYIFHLYARNGSETIKPAMGRTTLIRGYRSDVIGEATYTGVYGRS